MFIAQRPLLGTMQDGYTSIRPTASPIVGSVLLQDAPAITSLTNGAGVPPGVTLADGTVTAPAATATASTGVTSGSVAITSVPNGNAATAGGFSQVISDLYNSAYFWPVVLVGGGLYIWHKSKGAKGGKK